LGGPIENKCIELAQSGAQQATLRHSYERNSLAETIQPSNDPRATAIAVAAALVAKSEISEAISQKENTNDVTTIATIRASLIGKLAVAILAELPAIPSS